MALLCCNFMRPNWRERFLKILMQNYSVDIVVTFVINFIIAHQQRVGRLWALLLWALITTSIWLVGEEQCWKIHSDGDTCHLRGGEMMLLHSKKARAGRINEAWWWASHHQALPWTWVHLIQVPNIFCFT